MLDGLFNYKYKNNLDKNIFRGYDVRGVYPTNLDEDTAYTFIYSSIIATSAYISRQNTQDRGVI